LTGAEFRAKLFFDPDESVIFRRSLVSLGLIQCRSVPFTNEDEMGTTVNASISKSWIEDITIEELENDPNTVYSRLRAEAPPIVFLPLVGLHIATTAEACRQIASDSDNRFGVISPAGGRTFGPGAILNENGPSMSTPTSSTMTSTVSPVL
jgi:hypothetical protein